MTKNNEQIKLSLHLKSKEDLNEKIIKEKGNTKCIFYADDICRNGDKTRDCVNCARVEYHSLYSLNWDNQERLQKIIKHKEQECEELKAELELFKTSNQATIDQLKKELEAAKGLAKIRHQCLEAVKELANNANLPNVGLYIDSFLNEMFNKDENCHFDKIKELTKEM